MRIMQAMSDLVFEVRDALRLKTQTAYVQRKTVFPAQPSMKLFS